MEHRSECDLWILWNNRIVSLAMIKGIFLAILNKLHHSRHFAMRELIIATYKRNILDEPKKNSNNNEIAKPAQNHDADDENKNRKKRRKMDEKTKLERKVRNCLALRTFTYDITRLFPWICVYLSVQCTSAATYYVKTFASTSFYRSVNKTKHEKNKRIFKVLAISTLMLGVCVGIGKETYFESVKYAKRWFLDYDQYSFESYKAKQKEKEVQKQAENEELKRKLAIINESEQQEITPGGGGVDGDDDLKDEEIMELLNKNSDSGIDRNQSVTTDEESDQIEGEAGKTRKNKSKTPKYNALQERLINGNYQQETDMLLSTRYFHQKANDIFEYMTEICVFLEDKFINSLIIPVY